MFSKELSVNYIRKYHMMVTSLTEFTEVLFLKKLIHKIPQSKLKQREGKIRELVVLRIL